MNEEIKKEIIPVEKSEVVVVLQGDPKKQMEFAKESADVVCQYIKPLIINGKKYWAFEHWQTAARFYGASVGIEWTKPIVRKDKDGKGLLAGYEAKAVVYMKGEIISSAEAMCMRSETNWKNKDTKGIFIAALLIGTGFLISTIYLQINHLSITGINLRYLQPSISTPITSLIFAIVFYVIAFFLYKQRNKSDK